MRLSAPIYRLKRQAKLIARQKAIRLHEALDQVAINQGYQSWSHLASVSSTRGPAAKILSNLNPGDMILIGARPGQGKTSLGFELASKASEIGRKGFFFTLDFHERDIENLASDLGIRPSPDKNAPTVDTSDQVSAEYVINHLKLSKEPALVVVDYLQLLDQKRVHPSLDEQVQSLRQYVTATDAICVLISQVDRAFDLSNKSMPGVSDIRLPNPIDLSVFDKMCFLHDGAIHLQSNV